MFIDRVVVDLTAGKGGDGIIAWRREKYIPKGGPSGGNGGRGGSIIFEASDQVYCLDWFRHRKKLQAENGKQGGTNDCQGRCGEDLILKVPCGTLIKDAATGEILHDLTKSKDQWIACYGGKGGLGNSFFQKPTDQAPNKCTPGKPGQEKRFELELKLIADVGLVGFPNAGKSTLITALANVRVKIAPYPFTTLHPNLGMMQFEDYTRLFIADIPGIIEGAHNNRGLGIEFLRHIERTKLLVFVLDASGIDGRDPAGDYQILQDELKAYQPGLLERPSLVVLNKCDTEESILHIEHFKEKFPGLKVYEMSALEREGVAAFKEAIYKMCK